MIGFLLVCWLDMMYMCMCMCMCMCMVLMVFRLFISMMQLENSDGSPLTSQFVATAGAVTLGPSVTSGSIDVTLLADAVPEEAMRYTLRLVNVTGGGRLASSSETALITVSDSDDAYGVVSFAPDSSQSISSVSII